MASTIAAVTTGGGGVIVTSDATGNLSLLSGATTVVAVTATGASVTGTLAATGAITGSSTVAGSTGILYPLTSGTSVASTSGTSIDFTSIPSWVKRITVMFSGVSTNGASNYIVQIGSGSVIATGYISTSSGSTSTAVSTIGFLINNSLSSGTLLDGSVSIGTLGGNLWVESGITCSGAGNFVCMNAGKLALAGTLDRIRITTVNGTDTFDAGTINIMYE